MKKTIYLTFLAFMFVPFFAIAQSQTYTVAQTQTATDKKSTGNNQDVLANYVQVAANNITSANQNVTLKLNWFALNSMDSVHKYEDSNFLHSRWQRNGQFLFAGGMNKNNSFNSFQAGVSFNVLNLNDSTEFNYFKFYKAALLKVHAIEKKELKLFVPLVTDSLKKDIDKIVMGEFKAGKKNRLKIDISNTIKSFPTDQNAANVVGFEQVQLNNAIQKTDTTGLFRITQDLAKYGAEDMLDIALDKYTTTGGKQSVSFDTYVDSVVFKKLTVAIDADIKGDTLIVKQYKATGLTDLDQKIVQQYDNLVSYVARQPLITAAYNYTYATGTTPSSQAFGFNGSWGLNKLGSKKTNELTGSLSDTLTSNSTDKIKTFDRDFGDAQVGINTVLMMSKNASVMELNVGVENQLLFTKPITGEDRDKFSFNATYRVRLPGSPWLKLTFKYDPKTANILGLINFTYNIDTSSAPKK